MARRYDLIVVGTGWYGLVAAKTYMDLHPLEEVLVLESDDSVGGVWSANRLYPQLITQNMLDTYEYPGFPMPGEVYGVKPHQHIPGAVVHRYLTDYAKHFGVYERISFNTKVESLEADQDGGWIVTAEKKEEPFRTRKVIIATGLMSQPNFPKYPGAETFGAPHFHAKDFCQNADTVETAESVVVVGSAKSAFDVAYTYAASGVHVDLVTRTSGKGPVWMSYPWVMGGTQRMEKLFPIRFLTWFSPCPFGGVDGWGWVRNLMHGTRIGRFLVDKFWGMLNSELVETIGYDKHPELAKLRPRDASFWSASSVSLHNYDQNLFEMIKSGLVKVHVADVEHLTPNTVHLTNGQQLQADVLVCATGWKKEPPIRFVNFGEAGPLGLPNTPAEQKAMIREADEKILSLYPRLRDSPAFHLKFDTTPFRLYRYIVPPARYKDHNIAFAGFTSSASTPSVAAAQALWISAYFDNRLDKAPVTSKEVADEVMLHTQWGKWRYPYGYGANFPDFIFDALPYIDLLLNDLGLKVRRKPSLWDELFHPYAPQDYVGLVEEWADNHPRKM